MNTKREFDFGGCDLSAWTGSPYTCRWCDGLLPKHRITSHPSSFCTPTCTWEWKQQHVWATAKKWCVSEAKHRCQNCGEKSLRPEAHHVVEVLGDRAPSCLHHQTNLVCLCSGCHKKTHSHRRTYRPAA